MRRIKIEGIVRWQLADVEFIQRGHPLVREEPFLFCTLVGFQVLTMEDNDMKTMKEFLTWYNNKDVEPMLEAIDKMFQFNQNRHIDMFKDGISYRALASTP
jgi:hypothetical protein